MDKLVLASLCLLVAVGCGGALRDRLRHRASADLVCPAGSITLEDVGAGGWHAAGCGSRARYVCASRVCALEGEIERTSASGGDVSLVVAPFACTAMGATQTDAAEIQRALADRAPAIADCGATHFAIGVERGLQQVSVLSANRARTCVSTALSSLAILSQAGVVLQCDLRN